MYLLKKNLMSYLYIKKINKVFFHLHYLIKNTINKLTTLMVICVCLGSLIPLVKKTHSLLAHSLLKQKQIERLRSKEDHHPRLITYFGN